MYIASTVWILHIYLSACRNSTQGTLLMQAPPSGLLHYDDRKSHQNEMHRLIPSVSRHMHTAVLFKFVIFW